jgi:hypothetical protein
MPASMFDRVTKQLEGKQAHVEVASLQLGDQIQAKWLPLLGLSYDPHDDAVEFMLEGIDVTISKPREIHFDGAGDSMERTRHRRRERSSAHRRAQEPLLLPAA